MDFELSKKTTAQCKSLKLTAEQLVFADLVAVGWEPNDAYIMAFRKGATWIKKALGAEVEKLLQHQPVKNRIDETKSVLSERQKEAVRKTSNKERSAIIDTAMSKEQMLYDLQTAKATMVVGSKEWLDTNKLIVDVTRMKQDEVSQDDSTIHFYVPLKYPTGCQDCIYQRCNTCKYKLEFEEKKKAPDNL